MKIEMNIIKSFSNMSAAAKRGSQADIADAFGKSGPGEKEQRFSGHGRAARGVRLGVQ